MKLSPGSNLGSPLSPRCLPCSLTSLTAVLSCSGSQFSQFCSCTEGSADSRPNESTAPSDRVSTSVLVISVAGSMLSAMIEGLALST